MRTRRESSRSDSHILPGTNGLTSNQLILLVTAFVIGFGNFAFFVGVLKTYPPAASNMPALLSLVAVLGAATLLVPALLCFGSMTKPILIILLLLSALTAYFMDSLGVVISDEMLQNVVQTNAGEARDLLNLKLLAYVFGLGVVPAMLVGRVSLRWRGWRAELLSRLKLLALSLIAIVVLVLLFGSFYASFAREHKALRTFANPAYPLYSLIKFAHLRFAVPADRKIEVVGTDAHLPQGDLHRELIILVVGETARADHFALNGYARDTNPRLRELEVVSFTDFRACGTSTAVSLPCMFAVDGSQGRPDGKESLLDVLQHAGVNVLWLDNNSDSKGVALRVPYRNFKSPEVNTICDVECRDEGMLVPLQDYIDSHPTGDIFIVLHQMGNHGPAYYKRYPPAFERFVPACRNNNLSQCSREEIVNAYDNALLYTDDFLAKTIELLKKNSERFEAALFYVSDHGESLGEGGTYLHGLPRSIAPEAQWHVPALMWFSDSFNELDRTALLRKSGQRFTHDNLFHTVLGFMEIETAIYRSELDILEACRKPEAQK
jgi:lipid A ethanolaminephosphotransferase